MTSLKVVLLGIVLAFGGTSLFAVEVVSHQELGLRIAVTDGFQQFPEVVRGDVIYAFQRPPSIHEKVATVILVQRMGGMLGREKYNMHEHNPRFTTEVGKWKEFEIEVAHTYAQSEGIKVVSFTAQIPLKPEAVQISVGGDADREDDIREVLVSLLVNLDGQTNWLTEEERRSRIVDGVLVVIAAIGGGVWWIVQKWKGARRGAEPAAAHNSPAIGGNSDCGSPPA